jgi:aminoglycoside phosphotransferase (APT) family kinase protein
MATASINKLGSLVLGPNGTIDIGPLPASFGFEGPFTSTADYFLSWAAHAKFGNLDFLHGRLEDNDRLRSLKRAVISFPSRLKSAVEKRSSRNPTAYENRYPIIHRDFLPHNILFDDTYNVVGVIDWEFAHSAPLEVFTALTNMYSCFDSKTLHAVTDRDKEGRQYIKDVIDEEKDIRQGCKLSQTFGSILGDIGLCMTYFEEGRAVSFGELLDRYESETITSSFDPNSVECQTK